jgi:peptide/nickel transport system substrate-binding protein
MVENDAEGKLTGYNAGKSIKLVRNPNWDKATDFKPAYLDGINLKTNVADASVDAQQVLTGSKRALAETRRPRSSSRPSSGTRASTARSRPAASAGSR